MLISDHFSFERITFGGRPRARFRGPSCGVMGLLAARARIGGARALPPFFPHTTSLPSGSLPNCTVSPVPIRYRACWWRAIISSPQEISTSADKLYRMAEQFSDRHVQDSILKF